MACSRRKGGSTSHWQQTPAVRSARAPYRGQQIEPDWSAAVAGAHGLMDEIARGAAAESYRFLADIHSRSVGQMTDRDTPSGHDAPKAAGWSWASSLRLGGQIATVVTPVVLFVFGLIFSGQLSHLSGEVTALRNQDIQIVADTGALETRLTDAIGSLKVDIVEAVNGVSREVAGLAKGQEATNGRLAELVAQVGTIVETISVIRADLAVVKDRTER